MITGEDAFGDYRGDASSVEQADEEQGYAWRCHTTANGSDVRSEGYGKRPA